MSTTRYVSSRSIYALEVWLTSLAQLILTSREYMREVSAVEPKWLVEVAPSFFKIADQNTISKHKKQEKIAPLFDKVRSASVWSLGSVTDEAFFAVRGDAG